MARCFLITPPFAPRARRSAITLPVAEDAKRHPRSGIERVVIHFETREQATVPLEPFAPADARLVAAELLLGLHITSQLIAFVTATTADHDEALALAAQGDRSPGTFGLHRVGGAPVDPDSCFRGDTREVRGHAPLQREILVDVLRVDVGRAEDRDEVLSFEERVPDRRVGAEIGQVVVTGPSADARKGEPVRSEEMTIARGCPDAAVPEGFLRDQLAIPDVGESR